MCHKHIIQWNGDNVASACSDALKWVCHWATIKSQVWSRGATLTDSYKRAFTNIQQLERFPLPCDLFILDDCCSFSKVTWRYHRNTKGHWRCCSQIKGSFFVLPNQEFQEEREALLRYPFWEWKKSIFIKSLTTTLSAGAILAVREPLR